MGSTQIILLILGIAGLMFLYKWLFGTKATKSDASLSNMSVEERSRRAARQANVFVEKSMLLVGLDKLDEGYARIGAALFVAGAVKYVTQQWHLDDATYLAIIGMLVVKTGIIPEEQVHSFAADLVTIPEGSPEWRMAEKGFNAAQEWLADKDYTAIARLARYVKEWAGQSTEQPA